MFDMHLVCSSLFGVLLGICDYWLLWFTICVLLAPARSSCLLLFWHSFVVVLSLSHWCCAAVGVWMTSKFCDEDVFGL